jgi:ABC-2 type transport system permease protein
VTSTALPEQVGLVARRSVRRVLRQPGLIVPVIAFPLILLLINSAGLEEATRIPGFPTDSYLDFAIVTCFIQGALFSTTTSGTEIAEDISSGFLSRLSLTPLRRTALVAGQLAGAVTVGMIGALCYLAAGLLAGVEFRAGVGGVLVLLVLAFIICVAFAALGAFLGVRTGSGEAVQGAFPLLFVLFFLSSINLPRPLIEIDWFRTIATWNPISYMVEGMRSLVIVGWDATALLRGFGVAAAIIVLALLATAGALRTRMERT